VAGASTAVLKKVPLFEGLDDRELGQIASSMRERRGLLRRRRGPGGRDR